MMYRSTPHSTTGRTPSELMFGRNMRTKLSLMKPDLRRDVEENQDTMNLRRPNIQRILTEGSIVLARNYRGDEKWSEGVFLEQIGAKHYNLSVRNQV